MRKLILTTTLLFSLAVFIGCDSEDATGDDTSSGTDTYSGQPYLIAGDWAGYGWTDTGSAPGGTINELSQDYNIGNDSVCVAGTLVASIDSLGVFGMNTRQGVGVPATFWSPGDNYSGVAINITQNQVGPTIRLELIATGGMTYCAELVAGENVFNWSDFLTECWADSGTAYAPSVAIESIQVYAAGSASAAQQFNFCINRLNPVIGAATVDTDHYDTGTPMTVNKFVGNITTNWNASIDFAGLKFSNHWDQITPENAGKWVQVQPTKGGTMDWSQLDAIYAYAEDNNIAFKQHAFVWGNQEPMNADQIQESDLKNWMNTFCDRYPNTQMIDVVNEPPPHTEPSYAENIGGGTFGDWAWVINSFRWAREACPAATLILNDYNNIEYKNQTDNFIGIAKALQAAGAPLDALGAQAHGLDSTQVSTDDMKTLLARLHDETGLPVYISEYDISTTNDGRQLDLYKEHMTHFLQTDYVAGITIWGWVVGQTWSLAPDSGLVNANGTPRPAMTWLMNTLSRPVP